MTRSEFLEKLREALSNDLNNQVVQEHIRYYDSYIAEEVSKGRSEEEVIAELGDPWVLAQTVIDMSESTGGYREGDSGYETAGSRRSDNQGYRQEYSSAGRRDTHVFQIDSWWKKLLVLLGIIGILVLVVAVIGGIFSLLAPFIVPILIIVLVMKLIGDNRRW